MFGRGSRGALPNGLRRGEARRDNFRFHDYASNQTTGLRVSSYYCCHMALLCRHRRDCKSRHNQHKYKTRSLDIVPQIDVSLKQDGTILVI